MTWKVGQKSYGFSGGYFGRDSYEDKTCIQVGFYAGVAYAVFVEERYGGPSFSIITGEDLEALEEYKQPEKPYKLTLLDIDNEARRRLSDG